MTFLPEDLFIVLVIASMSLFAVGLAYVSITDRDPKDTHPAE